MKNILLCFIERTDEEALNNYLTSFEKAGFEIHIFNEICKNEIKPHNIPYIIDSIFNKEYENNNFYFLSNIKDLVYLVYRVYNQTFKEFVYYNDKNNVPYNLKLESIYIEILNKDFKEQEQINSVIFTNTNEEILIEGLSNKIVYLDSLEMLFKNNQNKKIGKYYYFNNKYYLFEPFNGEKEIINLSCDKINSKRNYFNTELMCKSIVDKDLISILNDIEESNDLFLNNYKNIQQFMDNLKDKLLYLPYFQFNFYKKGIELLSLSYNDYIYILLNSFLIKIDHISKYINNIIKCALNTNELDANEKFFVLFQVIRLGFLQISSADKETGILIRKLYKNIFQQFKNSLNYELEKIKMNERNKDFIMIFTGQFLTLEHGPTKTALDRCYSLMKTMNKKVILINTTDLLTVKGVVPYYEISSGNILREYENRESIRYKDINIPFYQSAVDMPSLDEIKGIINLVRQYKPYFILSIGGANITADLCSSIVPVITIATVMGIPITESQFAITGKKLSQSEFDFLEEIGMPKEHAIESTFTFDFKPQVNIYTREKFNLPEDKFLLLIVGARLDYEVTKEFIEALKKTVNVGTYFVFAGNFQKYNKYIGEDDVLRGNSTYLGFQDDMLAIAELCDIYINPPRIGGQTSAAEAMFKGLPVVSLNYGDVLACAQEEFCVNNLEEITERILKLIKDKNYYKNMSQKAKNRVKVLLDTDTELKRNIEMIENSKLFF